ncbi:hypothetical protein ACH5RR_036469 [Cinchona calisaya]|uniref:Transposase-associated domain-containing protein n=1 Tax=Cinchona calisaya TaxID=153742 RepID=A0ABD2Y759_9GENT
MDKTWMKFSRNSKAYKKGMQDFLDFSFLHSSIDGMILCPYKTCKNGICMRKEDEEVHLRCTGFMKGYTQRIAHGELSSYRAYTSTDSGFDHVDDMQEMLHDAYGFPIGDINLDNRLGCEFEKPNLEAEKFDKLVDDSQQELWPGCKSFSQLSFLVHMLHLKCLGKIFDKIFTMFLELLREAFPKGVKLPKSYYGVKKVIQNLGLDEKNTMLVLMIAHCIGVKMQQGKIVRHIRNTPARVLEDQWRGIVTHWNLEDTKVTNDDD